MTDAIECRVRFWFNAPRRTHKVMIDGKHVGDVWDDGTITIHDEPPIAHQGPRSPMYET